MGFEPYTTDELLLYYQQNISPLDEFDVNHILFVDDLQTVANKYHINESCENTNGFTIPHDGCIVAILNNLAGFDSMMALFHELTHVRDFIWFSKKYNATNIENHRLYLALQMYSEINAFHIGYKATIDFLDERNPIAKPYFCASMNLEDSLNSALCKKEIQLYSIFQSLGHIILYDDLHQIENHISHIPEAVSPRLRGAMKSILDAYFDNNLEEIDSIIHLLTV